MGKKTDDAAFPNSRAEEAREQIPGLAISQGIVDADIDSDPAIVSRLRTILDTMPDNLVMEVSKRLQAEATSNRADLEAFITKYNISEAERKLLAALIEGRSVIQHAEQTNISVNTARTHMRKLLEKTASSNQVDLVRKALGGDG